MEHKIPANRKDEYDQVVAIIDNDNMPEWCNKASRLARTIPDYDTEIVYSNRVLYQKRSIDRTTRYLLF
jgi:hypothetical protein